MKKINSLQYQLCIKYNKGVVENCNILNFVTSTDAFFKEFISHLRKPTANLLKSHTLYLKYHI
jgi:hypothetical protein